jgi:DNA invertase Pin-like site-specific DNA recombinase
MCCGNLMFNAPSQFMDHVKDSGVLASKSCVFEHPFCYARVSTAEQTIEHQLAHAHARAAGFAIDDVVSDDGVRAQALQAGRAAPLRQAADCDVLLVRWVDRLGRNYEDVCDVIREFMRRGMVIRTVINNSTPKTRCNRRCGTR